MVSIRLWGQLYRPYIPASRGAQRCLLSKGEPHRDIGPARTISSTPWRRLNRNSVLHRLPSHSLTCSIHTHAIRHPIAQPEDWYTMALSELSDVGFPAKITKMTLVRLLEEKYPHHKWEKVHLLRGKYAQQHRLEKAVRSLFSVRECDTFVFLGH